VQHDHFSSPERFTSAAATLDPYILPTNGLYLIRANYNGDTNYNTVTSGSASLTVYGSLNHFDFQTIGTQIAGTPFSITITAKDSNEVTVFSYNGANSLGVSQGTISPSSTGNFANGLLTVSVINQLFQS
jgi:hypothetical protein